MQLVIADTGPINYLILIEHIDLLPRLSEKVILPTVVQAELADELAPLPVRRWIANPPAWLQIVSTPEMFPAAGLHKRGSRCHRLGHFSRCGSAAYG